MNLLIHFASLVSVYFTAFLHADAPGDDLRTKIAGILADKQAVVGVSIIARNGQDTLSFHGDWHFPMQSVFKFHIALAVLADVDKGKLSLDQEIDVRKEDYLPEDFWSPMRDENPEGRKFRLAEIIRYAVSQSDNSACDLLIDLIGSPKTVEEYIRSCGIRDIQITHNEENMQAKWENMYDNWTTPKAASEALRMFYDKRNKLLAENTYEFFWKTNIETTTGPQRIRGLLPAETIVAHKTGSSGTNDETGITAATNDIGIIFLPNGEYFILSVFVSESKEDHTTNEKIIAEIARAAYDHYAVGK